MGKENLQRARGKGGVSFFGLGTYPAQIEYSLNSFRMTPTVLEEFMNWLGHHSQIKNTHMRKLPASIWFPCFAKK